MNLNILLIILAFLVLVNYRVRRCVLSSPLLFSGKPPLVALILRLHVGKLQGAVYLILYPLNPKKSFDNIKLLLYSSFDGLCGRRWGLTQS